MMGAGTPPPVQLCLSPPGHGTPTLDLRLQQGDGAGTDPTGDGAGVSSKATSPQDAVGQGLVGKPCPLRSLLLLTGLCRVQSCLRLPPPPCTPPRSDPQSPETQPGSRASPARGDEAQPEDHGSDLWRQRPAKPGRRFVARAARCSSRGPSCCPSRCRPSQLDGLGQTLKNPSYSRHAEEAWLQTARTQQHAFLPGRAGRSCSKPLPKAAGVEAAAFQESSPHGTRCRQPAPAPDPGAALGGSCWEAERGDGAAARAGGYPFLFSKKGRNAALGFALLWLHGTGGRRCFPGSRR